MRFSLCSRYCTDLFEDPHPDRRRWQQAETWDKGHGRVEHRHITCSPDLNDWFARTWEGIEQVFRLERTVRLAKTNQLRHEVVYGLSSLSLRHAPPGRMLQLIRSHWAIENRLHHRRDVSLGEDACQTRTGTDPSLLARLNSTVLSLMDRAGVRNVARHMRYFDAHLDQALALVLIGQCSIYSNWKTLTVDSYVSRRFPLFRLKNGSCSYSAENPSNKFEFHSVELPCLPPRIRGAKVHPSIDGLFIQHRSASCYTDAAPRQPLYLTSRPSLPNEGAGNDPPSRGESAC